MLAGGGRRGSCFPSHSTRCHAWRSKRWRGRRRPCPRRGSGVGVGVAERDLPGVRCSSRLPGVLGSASPGFEPSVAYEQWPPRVRLRLRVVRVRALGGIRPVARLLLQGSERRAACLPPFGARTAREAIGQPSRPLAPEAAEVPAVRAPDAPQVAGLREELLDGGGPRAGALATAAVVKAWWCGWCGRCAPSCCQEAGRLHVGLWRPEAVRKSAAPCIPEIATLHGRRDDRRALACRCRRSCRELQSRYRIHEHSEAPTRAWHSDAAGPKANLPTRRSWVGKANNNGVCVSVCVFVFA